MTAVDRGSKAIHAAQVVDVPYPAGFWGPSGSFPYPERTALCGQDSWGDAYIALDRVTCPRCRAQMAKLGDVEDIHPAVDLGPF
jgi:hypothetical protein